MKKAAILFLCFIALVHAAKAGTIKGIVLDNVGETAIGAVISIENTGYGAVAGLDGSFVITGVPKGDYKLHIMLLSFEPLSKDVTISDDNQVIDLTLSLAAQTNALKEAVIVGHMSGVTDANARQLEKNSDNVMNILSGKTIQLMPDVTVANVLRRVSGVTVDRGESGEGRYPVIRGMDKRYNYTLVNGIKIPSPDDKNRYVPMDIFPSEMLQRLEVIKALTPDMEGDAIGGVMNMVMKDAPDHLVVQAQAGAGYSQMLLNEKFMSYDHGDIQMNDPAEKYGDSYVPTFNDFSKKLLDFKYGTALPDGQIGLTIGNRLLHHKLGVLFSGMMQNTDRSSKEIFFVPNPQPQAVYNGMNEELTDMQTRYYSIHESRTGAHLKLDYDINKNNKISFYTVLMKMNTYQSRYMVDSTSTDRTVPGTGEVDLSYRSKTTLQTIYNATLQGEHKLSNRLSADWSAVYSMAQQKTPDWAELDLSHTLTLDSAKQVVAPAPGINGVSYIWQHNTDEDVSGYLNLHYKFESGDQKFEISTGGMIRHKDRSNYYDIYSLEPSTPTTYTNIYSAPFIFPPSGVGEGSPVNDNIYTSTEDVVAGYVEAKWQVGKWNILGGVRNESTQLTYNEPTEPVTFDNKSGTISYSDILPSLHIKYKLTDIASLHASYYASISRPGFFEVVPYTFPGEYFTEIGNPYLKHTQADNFDLRYELFPGSTDQLLIGAFYKVIHDPIEYVYERYITNETELQPQNLGVATNMGAELVYTKYFKKFGISVNYTYTYSNIPTQKKFYYDSTPGGMAVVKYVNQNRPLEGQAANIGNISLLYKDPKTGIDLQLSGIYNGRHIIYVSPYYDLDYWQRGTFILDFSAEKKLGKHFSVYVKMNNLLNTADIVEIMQSSAYLNGEWPIQTRSDRVLVEKKYYGQTYLAGVRFNL